MGHLRLTLLGVPTIQHDGQGVAWRTRKTQALLIYLAVEGGLHTRQQLTNLFWPERDQRHGRTMLRTTLVYLRQALQPNRDPVQQRLPHLLVNEDTLGFDFASDFTLDLHTLQAALDVARTVANAPQALAQLAAAVQWYRGDFLTDFALTDAPAFDDWASRQREYWHRQMHLIFDRLCQSQVAGGAPQEALTTALRWVNHDPLHEAAQQQLLHLYLTNGDRIAALRSYESYREQVARELNGAPSPTLVALAEQIRQADQRVETKDWRPQLVGAPSLIAGPQPSVSSLQPPVSTLQTQIDHLPLVGRAAEFARLIAAYHTVRQGKPQVVILEGEAGIGKTRLAGEFLQWAAAEGADVLQGRVFAAGGRLPYQPLIDALRRRVEQENAPDDLVSDLWLAELSRLLPELRDRYPDLPPPTVDESMARLHLFEAVMRLLQALAARAPLLLFIDDLQWADAASLDLLHYVAQRWVEFNTPTLLLLNLRREELPLTAGTPITMAHTDWLVTLGRGLPLTRLRLSALTPDNTRQLLQTLAGRPPASGQPSGDMAVDWFSQWLTSETAGQPFYIMETLKVLLEQGVLGLQWAPGGHWIIDFNGARRELSGAPTFALPPSVREMIRARLAHLSTNATTALIAGAVLGDHFDFARMCRVADLDESAALAAIDELLARSLLTEQAARYLFTHEKIREFLYSEVGETRRRVFHRRALELLETTAPPAVAVRHALAAHLPLRAFHLSVTAGDEAMRLFAVRDALGHYEQARALRSAELDNALGVAPLHHLFLQLGRAYEYSNDLSQAGQIYQAMLACAEAMHAPQMQCAALIRQAYVFANDNFQLAAAGEPLQAARHLADHLGDRASLAEIEYLSTLLAHFRFEPAVALQHGAVALQLATDLGLTEMTMRILNELAANAHMLNQWRQAEAYANAGLALYPAVGNQVVRCNLLCLLARSLIARGETQAGLRLAHEARALAIELKHDWVQVHSAQALVAGLLDVGEYREALTVIEATQAATPTQNHYPFLPLALGTVYRALGALTEARAAHLVALERSRQLTPPYFVQRAAAELCADCVLAGDWPTAHHYARQALASGDVSLLSMPLVHWCKVIALFRGGEEAYAAAAVVRFGELWAENPRYEVAYHRAQAVLSHEQGKLPAAILHLRTATTQAKALGILGELWQLQATLEQWYAAHGEHDAATLVKDRATQLVQTLAAMLDNE